LTYTPKIILSGGEYLGFGNNEAALVGKREVILLDENYAWSESENKDGYYSVNKKN
jgi:hypothetical protein